MSNGQRWFGTGQASSGRSKTVVGRVSDSPIQSSLCVHYLFLPVPRRSTTRLVTGWIHDRAAVAVASGGRAIGMTRRFRAIGNSAAHRMRSLATWCGRDYHPLGKRVNPKRPHVSR